MLVASPPQPLPSYDMVIRLTHTHIPSMSMQQQISSHSRCTRSSSRTVPPQHHIHARYPDLHVPLPLQHVLTTVSRHLLGHISHVHTAISSSTSRPRVPPHSTRPGAPPHSVIQSVFSYYYGVHTHSHLCLGVSSLVVLAVSVVVSTARVYHMHWFLGSAVYILRVLR